MTDPDHASPVNKDITDELKLVRGTRIINAFSVDSAHEEWHTQPMAHRPPGVYNPPSKAGEPPQYFPDNDKGAKSSANGFYAVELKLPDKAAFLAAYPGATATGETYLNYATTKKHALWEQSGYFWPKARYYDSTGWIEGTLDVGFKVSDDIDKLPPTPVVFRFAPPASARDLDFKLAVSLEETSVAEKAAAVKNTADGQGGEAMCYRGYGGGRVAGTDLTSGGWANALSGAEMKAIATTVYTDGKNPCSAVPGPPTDPSLQQWQRGVKPVCFMDVEQGTRGNRGLGFLCGWPGLYVCKGSTAFTNLLGFGEDDLCTYPTSATATYPHAPRLAEMARQNPFLQPNGLVRAVADRGTTSNKKAGMLTIKSASDIINVKALCFHCPTLAPPSYLPDGSMGGSQLASVPVVVPPGKVQSWQAGYDCSVPSMIHGQDIDAIEFYLTNQDQQIQDLQGSNFAATLRVSWSDPANLPAGNAGAVYESAVGDRAVEFTPER